VDAEGGGVDVGRNVPLHHGPSDVSSSSLLEEALFEFKEAPFIRVYGGVLPPVSVDLADGYPSLETPPEAPSAPKAAPAPHRRAQQRASERAEPPGAAGSSRPRRGRRARDLARREHFGSLAVSMGSAPFRWSSSHADGCSVSVLPTDLSEDPEKFV